MSTAYDGEAQSTLLFRFDKSWGGGARGRGGAFGGLALDAAKFFGVGEDEVHVFVKGEHLASHLTAVVQSNPHTIIDQILLLRRISMSLQCDSLRIKDV